MTRKLAILGLLSALVLGVGSCDGRPGSDTIDRETFIATYTDLRRRALTSPGESLDSAGRAAVLAEHGVTEEELLEFTEAHGRDVTYMKELWAEVETRMDSLPATPAGGP